MAAPSLIVGIVGNVISILVFASPVTTFWRIVKKKSTMNYEGLPYVTTLLCTSMWTYYGLHKPGGLLIVTVNGAGSVMQSVYVVLFLIYAQTSTRIRVGRLVGILNVGVFGMVILVTILALHGNLRLLVVGCMCAGLTVGMYAAPMAVMRLVVQTRSVEYMPFSLSFFLFLNGGVWGAYAFLVKDFFIGIPNVIGFVLGTAQLILYATYRKKSPVAKEVDLEMGRMDQIAEQKLKMASNAQDKNHLHRGASLPMKRSVSRQRSLTKIVKSLSLPPYENPDWSLDDLDNHSEVEYPKQILG
nr:bidirectional sugar transporter SWEET16 [Hemerocallis fulva]